MSSTDKELHELRVLIARLTDRVYRLEQRLEPVAPVSETERIQVPVPMEPIAPPPSRPEQVPKAEMPVPRFARVPSSAREAENLESRIGSQWLNRIGIVAVLIGVSYFLKYAFENNWIGPAGRISIGLLAGIGVVLWSERFRNRGHVVFSWSLKAVGIGTLYLSLWAAFQLYHLFPSGVAFAGMVLVTAATATLAITQNAQVLAAFALVGGFATPLLLSTGQNREIALFSYVTLLDVATLVLVSYRPWRRLLSGAFVGTLVLYAAWYAEYYSRAQLAHTITFATVFFALFAIAPLVAKHRRAAKPDEISRTLLILPLVNAAVYFVEIYLILERVSQAATAWIAVGLAAVYLLLSGEIRSRFAADDASSRVLTLLHIALAVGFLTAAIPLKLESYWITIGWLVEAGVLLWVAYRTASSFLKVLSLIALVLGVARLVMFDDFHPAQLVFNARFVIYLIAIGLVAFAVNLARKSENESERSAAAVGAVIINLLALVALNLEAHDYFARKIVALNEASRFHPQDWREFRGISIARDFTYSAIWMAYGAALMWVGFWKRTAFLRWQALVLLAATIVKVFVFDTSQLERGYRIISFIALGVLLLVVSFIYQRDWLKLSGTMRKAEPDRAKGSSAPA